MREVIIAESPFVQNEQTVLEKHPYMLDGYEEWKDDVRNNPYNMLNSEYKHSRYNNHLLYQDSEYFPFVGFMSSHTHKEEKVCRIVWDIVFSEEIGHKKNKLDVLPLETQEVFLQQIKQSKENGNSPVMVYVIHSCIDYHDNHDGMSLNELDSYLTTFENNYKTHHKGRLLDSVSLLSRLSKLVEKIF